MGKEYEMTYFGGKEDLTNGAWLIIYENGTADIWAVIDHAIIGYEDYEKIEYEEDFYGLRIPLFDADNFLNNFEIIKEVKITNDNLWESIIDFIEDHRGWDELQFTEEEIEKYSLLKLLELPEYEQDHFYMDRALKCIIQGIFNVCISCRFGNEEFSLSAIIDGKLYHYHNAYYTAD